MLNTTHSSNFDTILSILTSSHVKFIYLDYYWFLLWYSDGIFLAFGESTLYVILTNLQKLHLLGASGNMWY